MSWKGALIKAGISSDGLNVNIFRGNLTVYGTLTAGGGVTMDSIDIGTAAVPYALGTSLTLRAIEVYTSSASVTAGTSIRPIYMLHTVIAAGGVGHRAEFHTRCNVAAGTWINALKGYMEFDNAAGDGIAGRTTGLASAICAELLMPDAAVPTGSYFPLEIEFVGQTNSGPGVTHGFMTARASGVLTNFNASGFLLDVQGLTAAAGAMLSLTSQTLKCYLGTATRYMVMSQMEDGLGLGSTGTDMVLGTSLTKRAIEVYTSSASVNAETSVRPIYMEHTVLAAGGVGHRAEFHTLCNVAAGPWINALKGYIEFDNAAGTGVAGRTTGLASAVCAEMLMPDAAVPTGEYYPLEIEWVGQTNSGPGVNHGFMTLRASGVRTNFDASGFFFDIRGLTAGATAMLSTNSQTLKVATASGVTRYLVLSQATDCLSLSGGATPIVIAAEVLPYGV